MERRAARGKRGVDCSGNGVAYPLVCVCVKTTCEGVILPLTGFFTHLCLFVQIAALECDNTTSLSHTHTPFNKVRSMTKACAYSHLYFKQGAIAAGTA